MSASGYAWVPSSLTVNLRLAEVQADVAAAQNVATEDSPTMWTGEAYDYEAPECPAVACMSATATRQFD